MSRSIETIIERFMAAKKERAGTKKAWKIKKPDQYNKAIDMFLNGTPVKFIAGEFNISYETVRKTFQRDRILGPKMPKHTKVHSPGRKIDPGISCPCGVGMSERCVTHTLIKKGIGHAL